MWSMRLRKNTDLAVNGMSYSDRAGKMRTVTVIVTVTPEDLDQRTLLQEFAFQRKLEENAWKAGQGKVPVQRFEDFRKNRISTEYGTVSPCIKGAYTLAMSGRFFPRNFRCRLRMESLQLDHKIRGFAGEDVLLSGVESRTSSPVRIERNEQCVSEKYPGSTCGEGCRVVQAGSRLLPWTGSKLRKRSIRRYES